MTATIRTLARRHGGASTRRKSRRWGAWYVAEHQLRGMRDYRGRSLATAIGTPLLYLFAFGVGLATLVKNAGRGVDGVSYLQFVAPALICAAAVDGRGRGVHLPVLLGFKWNPIFFGMNAAPITGRADHRRRRAVRRSIRA